MFLKSKFLILLAGSTLQVTTVGALSANSGFHMSQNDQLLLEDIKYDLKTKSIFNREEETYLYNGKTYHDKNTIVDEIASANPIEAIQTTSNPSKIVKDPLTGILDGDQIYSTNIQDYVKVYKDALGRVMLPTCPNNTPTLGCEVSDKSAIDRAIDSYANRGLGVDQYTYDFGDSQAVNWYDDDQKAREAFQNTNYTPKSSLFYYINGVYYNAFNPNDLAALKSNGILTPTYYYDSSYNNPNLDDETQIQTFWKDRELFKEELRQSMYTKLVETNANIDSVFSSTGDFDITLTPDTSNRDFLEVTIENGGGPNIWGDKVVFDNKLNKLTFKELGRQTFNINPGDLIKEITSPTGWVSEMATVPNDIPFANWVEKTCDDYVYFHKTISLGVGSETAKITIWVKTIGDRCTYGYPTANPYGLTAIADLSRIQPKLIMENPPLAFKNLFTNFISTSNLEAQVQKEMLASSSITVEQLKNYETEATKVSNWSVRTMIKGLFNAYFDQVYDRLITDNFNDNLDFGWLRSDYAYGGNDGMSFSLADEQNEFEQKHLTNINLADSANLNLDQITSRAESFQTTVKNWKDNFYYLASDANSAIPLVTMWYMDNSDQADISEFSGLHNTAVMGASALEVKDLQLAKDNKILREQYSIYDQNGKVLIQSDNSLQAYEELRKKISLDYKMISANELQTYNNHQVFWEDVVSDGEYTVYKFVNSLNQEFYFKSYEEALDMYVNSLTQLNQIETQTKLIYSYALKINGVLKIYEFDKYSDQEIDKYANEIFETIKKGVN